MKMVIVEVRRPLTAHISESICYPLCVPVFEDEWVMDELEKEWGKGNVEIRKTGKENG